MTVLKTLEINNFRNLSSVRIYPGSSFNIIFGQNGAGKTSLLESIYYFGHARSFRANNVSNLVQHHAKKFILHSKFDINGDVISFGVERGLDSSKRFHLNGNQIKSIRKIAELLPIQLISTNSYRIFHDGPKVRRHFLNWGLFHVEPLFYSIWRNFTKLLQQRNAAIKNKVSLIELTVWNKELVRLSEQIDIQRKAYLKNIGPLIKKYINSVLANFSVELYYQRGWSEKIDYSELLYSNYHKDLAVGYTSEGPHRADFKLKFNGIPAEDLLSQGQQKLAAYSLYLAQGQLLRSVSKIPLYLIDDLPSELDPRKRHVITKMILDLEAQSFITGVTKKDLVDSIDLKNATLFHVESGKTALCFKSTIN